MKKFIAAAAVAAMLIQAAIPAALAEKDTISAGDSLAVGEWDTETAKETQALIDTRPDIQRRMEDLNRGIVAVRTGKSNFISWRWLGTESADTRYNLYRDGIKLNGEPLNVTNYTDINGGENAKYQVTAVAGGVEGEKSETAQVWQDGYFEVPIERPLDNEVNGEAYSYSAGDASVADLDGDGEYEIILKWDPSNAKDAANLGYTGDCIIDAYKMDGTKLWRINIGKNIRSGAHDTQFMVYDFDGDGKAEMICRTADGTVAGDGKVIGDADADWRDEGGKNLTGPLYLTAFKGTDGSVIDTVMYDPQTTGTDYDQSDWGDTWGNRSERYLAAIGSVNGTSTSAIFARGYYTGPEGPLGGRTVIASYGLKDGKLVQDWRFDTKEYDNEYIGQGNHSMSMADIDFDGCDEVIYGSLAVDHDGTPMYSTGLGHGDAQHVSDLIPSRPGLEVYSCHESTHADYGYEMRDARTGEILFGAFTGNDNGRAAAGDIDPAYEGAESWSMAGVLTAADGTVISTDYTMSVNFLNWWDGDLGRELQNNIYIEKWNREKNRTETIFTAAGCVSVNGTKATPSLTADILGDWREETIYPVQDQSALRIYTTTIPTGYKLPTLMSDTQYRNHVALQNTCYNQPTHLSYYLGYDTKTIPVPQMYIVKDGKEIRNPDLDKKSWNIGDLYSGEKIELVIGTPTALVNGTPLRIDNDDTSVVPYLSDTDNTLVPLRFIAESLGYEVEWDEEAQLITITSDNKDKIMMTIGSTDYVADKNLTPPGSFEAPSYSRKTNKMETAPVITKERTMVPLRAVAEAFDKNVYWNDGIITVSDIELAISDSEADAEKTRIKSAPVPDKIEPVALNGSGDKYYENQLDVYGVEASSNDSNLEIGAVDLDMTTRWSAYGPNTLTMDLGSVQEVEGVAIAMWKGHERIYPFIIEYSADGKEWKTALEKTQNTGDTEGLEKFMFPKTVSARYIRYNGDGATDPDKNYCHISEIAVLGATK